MSHYYSTIQGGTGMATRCGTKRSGITATANSWYVGATVSIEWSDTLQTDVVTVHSTEGSHTRSRRIMSYAYIDGKFTVIDTQFPELLV